MLAMLSVHSSISELVSLLRVMAMPTLAPMAALTIRKLGDDVKSRLRIRAAQNGRSMEEEARVILSEALGEEPRSGFSWLASIREKMEPAGGIDLDPPSRNGDRKPSRARE
jgi:plasmid stability protein